MIKFRQKNYGLPLAAIGSGLLNTAMIGSSVIGVKQASDQAIADRPVLAAKNDTTQYATFTVTAGTIENLTFNLKEWSTSKKFKTIALEYTTDGSTWTAIAGVGQVNASSGFAITNYTVSNFLNCFCTISIS